MKSPFLDGELMSTRPVPAGEDLVRTTAQFRFGESETAETVRDMDEAGPTGTMDDLRELLETEEAGSPMSSSDDRLPRQLRLDVGIAGEEPHASSQEGEVDEPAEPEAAEFEAEPPVAAYDPENRETQDSQVLEVEDEVP